MHGIGFCATDKQDTCRNLVHSLLLALHTQRWPHTTWKCCECVLVVTQLVNTVSKRLSAASCKQEWRRRGNLGGPSSHTPSLNTRAKEDKRGVGKTNNGWIKGC
ncbi:hypothetical protein E2C01_049633 [Portunus trituberculatus]|uniref:Uncharacterized protein n=1 Tax=Portunus trituberculatus TaxID=210409 RepID=A0A5B7GDM8_PORTR|nr:hypothetical protein [Portunus trituberculatus]